MNARQLPRNHCEKNTNEKQPYWQTHYDEVTKRATKLGQKMFSLRFFAILITQKIYPIIPRPPMDLFHGLCAWLSLSYLGSPKTQSRMSTAADKK